MNVHLTERVMHLDPYLYLTVLESLSTGFPLALNREKDLLGVDFLTRAGMLLKKQYVSHPFTSPVGTLITAEWTDNA